MTRRPGKYDPSGDALTAGMRRDIERQARVGGGISRVQAQALLLHIDRLTDILNEVFAEGPDWDDEQWALAIDAATPVVDLWTVRTSRKLVKTA